MPLSQRNKDRLENLGIAVAAGLITTVISALFAHPQTVWDYLAAFGIGFFGVLVGIEYLLRRALVLAVVLLVILILLILGYFEAALHAFGV